IYSFRGADIFAYMGAAKATGNRHTLLKNFRSEPGLIGAVNTLFSSRELPFVFDEIAFSPVEAADLERKLLAENGAGSEPLKFWFVPRTETGKPINKGDAWEILPEAVASEICRLLRKGRAGKLTIPDHDSNEERGVEPRDIAVLVRANDQARLMQRALTRRGIPSVLCGAGNLFESEEAAELLRILSAVAEPGHESLLRGALATDIAGVSGDELARLMEDEQGWEEVLEEFRCYHETWSSRGCISMMMQLMERRDVRNRLLCRPLGERRLTNLLHAVETIHQAQSQERLGMEGVITWLACRIAEKAKKEEYEIRLETDEAAVKLVTIHKSKGLEYPIVFLPFCWVEFNGKEQAALFHNEEGRVVLDIGSDELDSNRELADREELAESLRLLYVALTRGKHRTYLAWGAFKDAGEGALHYLLHPDASTVKGQMALSDDEIRGQLQALADSSSGRIELLDMPAADRERYLAGESAAPDLRPREFKGSVARDWRVASFTSLSSRQHHTAELPDHDEVSPLALPPVTAVEPVGIFAFPRGAKAGIFLHKIFEDLDFTVARQTLQPLVKEQLDKHGFAAEWNDAVCDMVLNLLQAPLGEDRFTLGQIGMERRCTEMEFFFPLASVTSERLKGAVAGFMAKNADKEAAPLFPVDMADLFSRLSFAPVRGMLLGFIDLVFEHGGRYYIVDWKSNHLGNSVEDYGQASLRREMEQNLYPLQYLLYTVALDSFLRLRIPDYDYDRHFGGIFYLFLRGVDGTGNGVFADRPPKEFIAELAEVLLPESAQDAAGTEPEADTSPRPSPTCAAEASADKPGGRGGVGKKSKKAETDQLSLDLF
ncbi:MAG TPA: exodeoxyribonuclease V subunit beta, partial [Geobacter sp.]|nr:exodeoxyribonuclease V subunit beta [Geobacter sp.]